MKRKTRRAIAASFCGASSLRARCCRFYGRPSGPMLRAFVGGPSGPMLLFQVAVIGTKSIGPEGPPTKVSGLRNLPRI
ncbi:DUF6053 domain-containing protein [Lysobacter gummosus]